MSVIFPLSVTLVLTHHSSEQEVVKSLGAGDIRDMEQVLVQGLQNLTQVI